MKVHRFFITLIAACTLLMPIVVSAKVATSPQQKVVTIKDVSKTAMTTTSGEEFLLQFPELHDRCEPLISSKARILFMPVGGEKILLDISSQEDRPFVVPPPSKQTRSKDQ